MDKTRYLDIKDIIDIASIPVVVYAMGFVFLYIADAILGIGVDLLLSFVHINGALFLWMVFRGVPWEGVRYDCFGAAFILVQIMFRLLSVIDSMVYGDRIDEIPRTVDIVSPIFWLIVKSEVLVNLGVAIVVLSWRLSIGGDIKKISFIKNGVMVDDRVSYCMYFLAILTELLKFATHDSVGPLTQVSYLTYSFGVVSIFFISIRRQGDREKIFFSLCMGLPLSVMALGSGMKENIFFPLIPAIIVGILIYRNAYSRIIMMGSLFILLSFSQMYVSYVRYVSWGVDKEGGYETSQLVSEFFGVLGDLSVVDSFDAMSARINMTTTHVITVSIADAVGYEPLEVFGAIPVSFVPRFLWPDKPVFMPGAIHTSRIEGARISGAEIVDAVRVGDINTSTAAGFFSELYLGGWYIGWFIGSVLCGLLLGGIQKLLINRGSVFSILGFSFFCTYWALRFDEKHVIYAYTSVIFVVIFLLIIDRIFEFLNKAANSKTALR